MIRRTLTLLRKQTITTNRLTDLSRAFGGLHNPNPSEAKEKKAVSEADDDAERIATPKVNIAGTKEPVNEQTSNEGKIPSKRARVTKKNTNQLFEKSPVNKRNRENIRLFSSNQKSPEGKNEDKEPIYPKFTVKEKLDDVKEAIFNRQVDVKYTEKENLGDSQEYIQETTETLNLKAMEQKGVSMDPIFQYGIDPNNESQNFEEKIENTKTFITKAEELKGVSMDPIFQYDLDLTNESQNQKKNTFSKQKDSQKKQQIKRNFSYQNGPHKRDDTSYDITKGNQPLKIFGVAGICLLGFYFLNRKNNENTEMANKVTKAQEYIDSRELAEKSKKDVDLKRENIKNLKSLF